VRRWILVVLLALAGPVLVMAAGGVEEQPAASRTPLPAPAKGKGESCVAPVEWMRRNHMTALMLQRDKTVHDGERGAKFSLKGCVECHAVKGEDGRAVSVSDPRHFCRSCHDYAAVHIDCFECHASQPGEPEKGTPGKAAAKPPGAAADLAALERYIKSHQP
jgi:predicted CXXCH cytochrome family protein